MSQPTRDQAEAARRDATAPARHAAYTAGINAWHDQRPTDNLDHLRAAEIVACGRCDGDGYRGGRVCDHQDHSTPAGRAAAIAVVAAALAKRPRA